LVIQLKTIAKGLNELERSAHIASSPVRGGVVVLVNIINSTIYFLWC